MFPTKAKCPLCSFPSMANELEFLVSPRCKEAGAARDSHELTVDRVNPPGEAVGVGGT